MDFLVQYFVVFYRRLCYIENAGVLPGSACKTKYICGSFVYSLEYLLGLPYLQIQDGKIKSSLALAGNHRFLYILECV